MILSSQISSIDCKADCTTQLAQLNTLFFTTRYIFGAFGFTVAIQAGLFVILWQDQPKCVFAFMFHIFGKNFVFLITLIFKLRFYDIGLPFARPVGTISNIFFWNFLLDFYLQKIF